MDIQQENPRSDLQSRMIFLDTSTYEDKNFQFEIYELARLKEFISSDDAYLLITDVTVSEVEKHLASKAILAAAAIKTAKKKAMILRNLPDLPWSGIFEEIESEKISASLLGQFHRFIAGPNVKIVPIASADTAKIFKDYFNVNPPFGSAGKKAEFPDAFVLDAINRVSQKRGHKLYVVSKDGDFKNYCALHQNLISITTISDILDLIVRNSKELSEPAEFADSIYELLRDDINANVLQLFTDGEYSDDEIDDVEFDTDDVEIEACDIIEKRVVEVTRDSVVYELDVALKVGVLKNQVQHLLL